MKRFLIYITILLSVFVLNETFAVANTNLAPANKQEVLLRHKTNSKNPNANRCPAMPIYGMYDGYTLSIDVVADDEAATYELVVTTAATQTVGQYTAVELNQGVAVPPLQPATIELTTPAGAVYVGEITD